MAEKSPFSRDILRGKVALVTGGASGIGYEIAKQLGIHGARLLVMGRRETVLQSAKQALRVLGIEADYFQGDVRSYEDATNAVNAAIEKFGRLDLLVNSAAGNFLSPAEKLTPKGFKTVIEIDTVGTFNMCHAAFPMLKRGSAKDGGLIINISATLHYGATWYQSHASAAKAAIDSLTRSLCLEWGPDYGIRVNGVAPGPVGNTAGMQKLGVGVSDEGISRLIPAGRLGTTWDIAMAVVFLVSSAGSWISGETLVVDGGHWLSRLPTLNRDEVAVASRQVESSSRVTGIPQSKL